MDALAADSTCPLCRNDNLCAMASGDSIAQCWCRNIAIPRGVKQEAAGKGTSCICRDCASRTAR